MTSSPKISVLLPRMMIKNAGLEGKIRVLDAELVA
jgi:hypothetical protein